MKLQCLILFVSAAFLSSHCVFVLSHSSAYDFFYFVLQWPSSYCNTPQGCCAPTSGAARGDFTIHGLWPYFNNGSHPSYCDPKTPFNESKIADLKGALQYRWQTRSCPIADSTKFWKHEWEKHGTCSDGVLDQHTYFESGLELERKIYMLPSFMVEGIRPNDKKYNLTDIKDAVRFMVGHEPYIKCNKDSKGNSQLYQIYLCVDTDAYNYIKCPTFPRGHSGCPSQVKFPAFNTTF